MSYFKSADIQIFPLNTPRDTQPDSNALSEKNILNLIRSITDKHSYVVSDDTSESWFEFVLYGYYIKVKTSALSTSEEIYAHLFINNFNALYTAQNAYDDEEVFYGVYFSNEDTPTVPDGCTSYTLHILSKGTIPDKSKHLVDGGKV